MCLHTQVCACTVIMGTGHNFECCSSGAVYLILRQGLSLVWNSTNRLGLLVSEPQGSCWLNHTCPALAWVLVFWLSSSSLKGKHFTDWNSSSTPDNSLLLLTIFFSSKSSSQADYALWEAVTIWAPIMWVISWPSSSFPSSRGARRAWMISVGSPKLS